MQLRKVTLLAIESSCDDTSAAVLIDGKIRSNVVAGQEVHAEWGGVVPELASRAHQQHIVPVVDAAIKKAGINKKDIDVVAFTAGPGLIGSLLVGASFAKSFALANNLPIVGVHHMQAHVAAHYIADKKPNFPFLCLTVSGGHTQIVLVNDFLDMEVIGSTIDDAAGEAFDKTAKMLGLAYPGGPILDKLAQEGNPLAFSFADPKVEAFDFSFSGVKTSVLYFLQKQERLDADFIAKNLNDICASVQHTIVTILIRKLLMAAEQYEIRDLAIAGGVSANSELRKQVELLSQKGYNTFIPKFEYCTDNAAMIAIAAYYKFQNNHFDTQEIEPQARWAMKKKRTL